MRLPRVGSGGSGAGDCGGGERGISRIGNRESGIGEGERGVHHRDTEGEEVGGEKKYWGCCGLYGYYA